MKAQPLLFAVTGVNIALVLVNLATTSQADPPAPPSVLRGEALELVDPAGRVRAQITLEPTGAAVFRLRDATGAIRVKLAASEDGSGLVLLDASTEPGVHLLSTGARGVSLTLNGKDGAQRVITPR